MVLVSGRAWDRSYCLALSQSVEEEVASAWDILVCRVATFVADHQAPSRCRAEIPTLLRNHSHCHPHRENRMGLRVLVADNKAWAFWDSTALVWAREEDSKAWALGQDTVASA